MVEAKSCPTLGRVTPEVARRSGLAIASLAFALVGLAPLALFLLFVASNVDWRFGGPVLLLVPAGALFSFALALEAFSQARQDPARIYGGLWMAMVGMIVSATVLSTCILWIAFVLVTGVGGP